MKAEAISLRVVLIGMAWAIAWMNSPNTAIGQTLTNVCSASDVTKLNECVEKANNGAVQRIEIAAAISCSRSAPCDLNFHKIASPLEIIGTADNAGLYRANDGGPAYGIHIFESDGPIVIRHLTLDEGKNRAFGAPGTVWVNASCPNRLDCPDSSISIADSRNVLIDDSNFLEAKNMGVSVIGSSGITIRGSRFVHSWIHGIWLGLKPSRGIHIEHDSFQDIRSNAVMFSGEAPDTSDPIAHNTIAGNRFIHNHNAAVYHVCGPTNNEPCGGGQLDVEQHSDDVIICNNMFDRGALDEDSSLTARFLVAGIEIAPKHVSNIIIDRNLFLNLTSVAISIDSPDVASEVTLTHNVLPKSRMNDQPNSDRLKKMAGNCAEGDGDCELLIQSIEKSAKLTGGLIKTQENCAALIQ